MSYLMQTMLDAERKGVAPAWPTQVVSSDGRELFKEHSANQTLAELWDVFLESYGAYDYWIVKVLTEKDYLKTFLDRQNTTRASRAVLARAIGSPANPATNYRAILDAATRIAQNYMGQPTLPDYLQDPGARIVLYLLIRHSRQLHLRGGPLRYENADDSDFEEEERHATIRDTIEMDTDSGDDDIPEVDLGRPQGGGAHLGHDFTASLPSGEKTSTQATPALIRP